MCRPSLPETRRILSVIALGIVAFGIANSAGCTTSTSPSRDASPHLSETDAQAPADAQPSAPWTEIFAEYDLIETLAGLGTIEDKGVNGWQDSYEGGDGTAAELSRPHISIQAPNGSIYIADKDAHAIRDLRPDGSIHRFAGTNIAGKSGSGIADQSPLSSPNGLWVSSIGVVYVLDLGNDRVQKISNGQMSTLFEIGGASTGRGLWVADDESAAYVAAGNTLKKWTPEGGVVVHASGFAGLGNIYVGSDERLVVSDRVGHRVYHVASSGEKVAIAGNGQRDGGTNHGKALEKGLDEVRGIWGHPRGGYFLATHKGGQIWYLDGAGDIHLFVDGDADDSHAGDGSPHDSPDVRISEPRAVTLSPKGDILITEHDAGYLRRVRRILD